MNDNNIEPIDPATCEPDRWYLVRAVGGHERAGLRLPRGAWYVPGETPSSYRDGDGRLTVVAELVRADEARQVAEWLIKEEALNASAWYLQYQRVLGERNTSRAECDRLRSECERLRDELAVAKGAEPNEGLIGGALIDEARQYAPHSIHPDKGALVRPGADLVCRLADALEAFQAGNGALAGELDQAKAECEKAQAERDEAVARLRSLIDENTGVPAMMTSSDPASASRLRLAIETVEAVEKAIPVTPGFNQDDHFSLQFTADTLRTQIAEAAREQERDALIEKALEIFRQNPYYPWGHKESAAAMVDAGWRPDDRNEQGQA